MLRTRLWMGAILVVLACAVLLGDFAPWYPFLFVLVVLLSVLACVEMRQLLGPAGPPLWLTVGGVLAVLVANWSVPLGLGPDPWRAIASVCAGVVLAAFLVEMVSFQAPGGSVPRIALAVWTVAYLGLLPSFLLQLRWWPAPAEGTATPRIDPGVMALALAIFVPKFCDIGAYFTGRFLGRHRMTPVLSPKKTWEGLAGGLVVSALVAVGLNRLAPLLGDPAAAAFGVTVGLAGVLGDLAESLIKRDCRQKDASQVVPGFGGVLDVIDSILFAAPLAYWWLR